MVELVRDLPQPPPVDPLGIPPHSSTAESAVIGGVLLDNSKWDQVADRLRPGDFYLKENQIIFAALHDLAESNMPLDLVTVSDHLEKRGELDAAGGLAYIGALANETPSAGNVAAYAAIVKENAIHRRTAAAARAIAADAMACKGTAHELLHEAEQRISDVVEDATKGGGGFQAVRQLLTEAINHVEEAYQRENPIIGLPTGFSDLDGKTAGLHPGELTIIAARTSMGKTTLAMNIAENVAIQSGKPVAVFSLEMPAKALMLRAISSLGRVAHKDLRSGNVKDDDWPRITSAVNILNGCRLFIDDTPSATPTQLVSKCRRLKREQGELGLVVVDYLQLMSASRHTENRTNEVSQITRGLKLLARETSAPVIALSQLNRDLEKRPNKRPMLADLRESGSIEQDADAVLFIYRDEVYNKDTPDKGKAEIIIGKQRNGPTGEVTLTFSGKFTRFDNFSYTAYGDESY